MDNKISTFFGNMNTDITNEELLEQWIIWNKDNKIKQGQLNKPKTRDENEKTIDRLDIRILMPWTMQNL